jgi:hypothetical protein
MIVGTAWDCKFWNSIDCSDRWLDNWYFWIGFGRGEGVDIEFDIDVIGHVWP